MENRPLSELMNIGKTVAKRLHDIGITNEAQLKQLGAVKAYQAMSAQHSGRNLPVCYYLYSLEGAIQDRHWNDFSEGEKTALRRAAGLLK